MASIGGRIDQPWASLAVGVHVAAPQIAMQARRRLGRPSEMVEPLTHALDRRNARVDKRAALACDPRERQQTTLA